jgi:hypothetical protein
MPDEIRFSYRPTFADNVLGPLAMIVRSKSLVLMSASFPLAGLVVLVLAIQHHGVPSATEWLVATAGLGYLPLFLLFMALLVRIRLRGVDPTQHYVIDDHGIRVSGALSTVELKWTAFRKAASTRSHLLLPTRPAGGLVLPWRVLEAAGVATGVRAAVAQHIGLTGRGGPRGR